MHPTVSQIENETIAVVRLPSFKKINVLPQCTSFHGESMYPPDLRCEYGSAYAHEPPHATPWIRVSVCKNYQCHVLCMAYLLSGELDRSPVPPYSPYGPLYHKSSGLPTLLRFVLPINTAKRRFGEERTG